MRLLLTNDDGIEAMGIQTLARVLQQEHEVLVVSPSTERSANSHSISIRRPLRVTQYAIAGIEGPCYHVEGTPADCVKIGLVHLASGKIDAVISGINHGQNIATDLLYSGTVGAAMEGCVKGLPAMAVPMTPKRMECLQDAALVAKEVIDRGFLQQIPRYTMLNLNVPAIAPAKIRGIRLVSQGFLQYNDEYLLHEDGIRLEGPAIWGPAGSRHMDQPQTDIECLEAGFASLTPISYDMTNHEELHRLRQAFPDLA